METPLAPPTTVPLHRSRPGRATVAGHLVIMGAAGAGKSTLAALLGGRLGLALTEADELLPAAGVRATAPGHPLADGARRPWLDAIGDRLAAQTAAGRGVVVACSALRRADRDRLLRVGGLVRFVHLTGSPDLLRDRVHGPAGHAGPVGCAGPAAHAVPPSYLPARLATPEPLAPDEDGLTVDAALPPDLLVELVVDWLRRWGPVSRR